MSSLSRWAGYSLPGSRWITPNASPGWCSSLHPVASTWQGSAPSTGGQSISSLPGVPRWFVHDRTDLSGRLDAIKARTLLLWSDADPVSPLSVGRALAARIPNSRLVTIAGGPHSFANDRPDEVAAAIKAHLLEET
jgi:pimeloyl-ACP methyl ester carboxylesterase